MKRILFYFLVFFTALGNAQNPGDVYQTFGSSGGFDKAVLATLVQPNDKIIVGGSFSRYNALSINGICRLNTDGTTDASFDVGSGFSSNSSVNCLALQTDGKIIVGGLFTTYKGVNSNNIIRLNSDGSIDNTFNYGTGFNGNVNCIKIQSDGKILVGGQFTAYNGATQNYMIRLNADGTKDTSFNIGTGFDWFIKSIAIQSDGKILVGGQFTTFNGAISPKSIIRLNTDGSKDTSFITSGGFVQVVSGSWYTGTVNAIELQSDGKIIVGGVFDVYTANTTSVSAKRIVRLNSDGTKDTSFSVNEGFLLDSGIAGVVHAIKILGDGKIIVGGDFNKYYSTFSLVNRIVRLNSTGTIDNTLSAGNGFDDVVYSVNILSTGKFIAGGVFSNYGFGSRCRKIACLNLTGGFDSTFYKGGGINGFVNTVAVQQDNKIIIGGSFDAYQNNTEKNIIRLNANGTKDNSFSTGTGFNSYVQSIILQSDGKIIVGGNFSTYNGLLANGIARLNSNGTLDASFNIGTGFNGSVKKLILQPDGKIVVLGSFSTYNGVSVKQIVRLNTDGTLDNSFNIGATGFNITPNNITLQSDGKIIVGGRFTQFNGNTENYILRLNADGTKDVSFNTGTGFNGDVNEIIVKSDGKIFIGGLFTTYNGVSSKNYVLGLNADGSIDAGFNVGTGFNGEVWSSSLQNDGKIIVGGRFSTYNGVAAKQIVRLTADGTLDSGFSTGVGFSNEGGFSPVVSDLQIGSNGIILAAGNFNIYRNSINSTSFIALHSGLTPLSNNDFELNNSVKIYPNPVKDILNITTVDNSEISLVKIYDLQGKLILETTASSIDTNNLISGLYFVNIITEKGHLTKKFIKE